MSVKYSEKRIKEALKKISRDGATLDSFRKVKLSIQAINNFIYIHLPKYDLTPYYSSELFIEPIPIEKLQINLVDIMVGVNILNAIKSFCVNPNPKYHDDKRSSESMPIKDVIQREIEILNDDSRIEIKKGEENTPYFDELCLYLNDNNLHFPEISDAIDKFIKQREHHPESEDIKGKKMLLIVDKKRGLCRYENGKEVGRSGLTFVQRSLFIYLKLWRTQISAINLVEKSESYKSPKTLLKGVDLINKNARKELGLNRIDKNINIIEHNAKSSNYYLNDINFNFRLRK